MTFRFEIPYNLINPTDNAGGHEDCGSLKGSTALVVFDLTSQSAPNQLRLIGNVLILFPGSISKHASKPSYISISRLRFNLNNQELQPPPSLHHRISDFGDILCSYDRSYEKLKEEIVCLISLPDNFPCQIRHSISPRLWE